MTHKVSRYLALGLLTASLVSFVIVAPFLFRNRSTAMAYGVAASNVAQYGARSDAALAYIAGASNGSPIISASGRFSLADTGKDVLVYAGSSPSTPGYRPNIFTGCIQTVIGPGTIRLGVWRGKVCTPTPYLPGTLTNIRAPFLYGHDGTEALQAAINDLDAGRGLLLDRTLFIHDTIVFRNKAGGEFSGITMNGQIRQAPYTGSNIVWAGPAGRPMFRFENSGGMYIHDLHFLGNSNPNSRPSALIDIAGSADGLPANRFQGISNMYAGSPDGIFDTADNGVYVERNALRIADRFDNIRLFNLGFSCISQNSGSSAPEFSDVTCQHAPIGVYCVNGGRVDLSGSTELITVGQIFHLGGACSVSALELGPENDSPGEEGITQLAYFERGNGGRGGGSLRIGRGGFGPVSKLPTSARPSFLGHRLTPNALIDTDTSAPIDLELGAFGFYYTARSSYAYTRPSPWLIHLPAVDGPSVHRFRCQSCLGLSARNIDLSPGGYMGSRNTVDVVNMPGFGATALFVNQVLSGNQNLNIYGGMP
jgi:hypothetical protein